MGNGKKTCSNYQDNPGTLAGCTKRRNPPNAGHEAEQKENNRIKKGQPGKVDSQNAGLPAPLFDNLPEEQDPPESAGVDLLWPGYIEGNF